jgi:hypothetical protein
MQLYLDHTGPLITYEDGLLRMADLNPQAEVKWRMSRWEMFRLGFACIRAAARRARGA